MKLIKLCGAEENYFRKRIVRIAALTLALIMAACFSVAFVCGFNTVSALFDKDNTFAVISYYGSFVSVIAVMLLTVFIVPKEKVEQSAFPKANEYVSYYKLDNMFIKVYRICLCVLICLQGAVVAAAQVIGGGGGLKAAGMLALSVAFALYFVPEFMEVSGLLGGRLHLAFGIFGMIFMIASTFNSYFDRALPLASEYSVLSQVGYIIALIALTYEIRYRFDGSCVRLRLASSCAEFLFGFGFGVGRVVMLMAHGQVSYTDTAGAVTMLAVSVYFGLRVFFYSED